MWHHVNLTSVDYIDIKIVNFFEKMSKHVETFKLHRKHYGLREPQRVHNILSTLVNVTNLGLSNSRSVKSLDFLRKMNKLHTIKINQLVMIEGDELAKKLPRVKSLRSLSVCNNYHMFSTDIIYTICKMPFLMDIDMEGVGLYPPQVKQVLNSCPQLKTFFFSGHFMYVNKRPWVHLLQEEYGHVKFTRECVDCINTFCNFRGYFEEE